MTMKTFRIHWILWSMLYMLIVKDADCGGRMIDPPMRSSMWRFNFNRVYANYDDMNLNCGGWHNIWLENDGKCGVCGDPADGPFKNEQGGIYDRNVIGRYYKEGQTINIYVDFTAAERGIFLFSLCDRNTNLTQDCFDQYPLQRESDGAYWVSAPIRESVFTDKFILPAGLTCTNCVLQWNHTLGNRFSCDNYRDGAKKDCCIGCGAQGRTVNCADIQILPTAAKIPARIQVPVFNPCRWDLHQTGCNGYQVIEPLIANQLSNTTFSKLTTMSAAQIRTSARIMTKKTYISPKATYIPYTAITIPVATTHVDTTTLGSVKTTYPPITSEIAKLSSQNTLAIATATSTTQRTTTTTTTSIVPTTTTTSIVPTTTTSSTPITTTISSTSTTTTTLSTPTATTTPSTPTTTTRVSTPTTTTRVRTPTTIPADKTVIQQPTASTETTQSLSTFQSNSTGPPTQSLSTRRSNSTETPTQLLSGLHNGTHNLEQTTSILQLNTNKQFKTEATAAPFNVPTILQYARNSIPLMPGMTGSSNNDKSSNLLLFLLTMMFSGNRPSRRTSDAIVLVPVYPQIPIARSSSVDPVFIGGSLMALPASNIGFPVLQHNGHSYTKGGRVNVGGTYGNEHAVNGHSDNGISRGGAITGNPWQNQQQYYGHSHMKPFPVISKPKIEFDNVPSVIREMELNKRHNLSNTRQHFVQNQQNAQTGNIKTPLLVSNSYINRMRDWHPTTLKHYNVNPVFQTNGPSQLIKAQNMNQFPYHGMGKHMLKPATVNPQYMPRQHSLRYQGSNNNIRPSVEHNTLKRVLNVFSHPHAVTYPSISDARSSNDQMSVQYQMHSQTTRYPTKTMPTQSDGIYPSFSGGNLKEDRQAYEAIPCGIETQLCTVNSKMPQLLSLKMKCALDCRQKKDCPASMCHCTCV